MFLFNMLVYVSKNKKDFLIKPNVWKSKIVSLRTFSSCFEKKQL